MRLRCEIEKPESKWLVRLLIGWITFLVTIMVLSAFALATSCGRGGAPPCHPGTSAGDASSSPRCRPAP